MKRSSVILMISLAGVAASAYPTYQCDAPNKDKYLITLGGSQAIVKLFRDCNEVASSVAGHDTGADLKSVFPHMPDHKSDHKLFLQPVSKIEFKKFEDESLQKEGITCRYVGTAGLDEVKSNPCVDDNEDHKKH